MGQIRYYSFSQALGSGGISETFTPGTSFKLLGVQLHGSAALTETVTITIDDDLGANYDTVLTALSLSSDQDSYTSYGDAYKFTEKQSIKITSTNAGAQTVYGKIIIEEI